MTKQSYYHMRHRLKVKFEKNNFKARFNYFKTLI